MPRTFLVERIMDLSSSVKDNETKFKVDDDVRLDNDADERDEEMQRLTGEQKMMTSEQQRHVAMDASVIDYRARAAVKPGESQP